MTPLRLGQPLASAPMSIGSHLLALVGGLVDTATIRCRFFPGLILLRILLFIIILAFLKRGFLRKIGGQ
ncbi:hypothetical protein HanRHA438_Chr12g0533471 [Helianthus annuus]|nr:hypothetical protein HanRHA438_Chr12g0533471 [Helianthus annuus]